MLGTGWFPHENPESCLGMGLSELLPTRGVRVWDQRTVFVTKYIYSQRLMWELGKRKPQLKEQLYEQLLCKLRVRAKN